MEDRHDRSAEGDSNIWPEDAGCRRGSVRIPTGSTVVVQPREGPARSCLVRNVGEGGLCIAWPEAPVHVNETVNLVFEKRDSGTLKRFEHTGVVKWCTAKWVGLVFQELPVEDKPA